MAHGSTWRYLYKYLNTNHLTYEQYLSSEHWHNLRERFYKKYQYECYVCGSTQNLQLHHKTYRRIGREHLSDLTWLCDAHHDALHDLERSRPARQYRLSQTAKRLRKRHIARQDMTAVMRKT